MDKGKLKGHAALWVANLVWGLNAPIGKSVLCLLYTSDAADEL